jgi:DNA polymerase I-like protein with 3'-5' exonuclease and polymerase domains
VEGVILTEEALRKEVAYFLKQDAFAFDIESMDGAQPDTRGVPTQNTVVWIALATHGRTICIPMGHPNGDVLLRRAHKKKSPITKKFVDYPAIYDAPPQQMRASTVFEILRPLFFDNKIKKIAHNETFDVISLEKCFGAVPSGPFEDTIVLQWIVDENVGQMAAGPKRPLNKKLKTLIRWYYGVDYDKEDVGKCIEAHPFSSVARYILLDARYDWLLWKHFTPLVQEQDLRPITELENQVTEVCCYMGLTGAPVDVQAIEELKVDLTQRLAVIESKIYRAAGKVFNINSNPQKRDILFGFKKDGGQGLKPIKFSKKTGEPSTDNETLKNYEGNAVVDALLEYQEVSKILNTYVIGYIGDEEAGKPCRIFNGRIHTDLVQYGTVTGRFSSREPNLQNIPRPDTELGKKIRGLFIAPPGYKLLVADYGQMELRILAHMLGYGGLYDGFQAGIDAHTQTASLVYGVPIDKVEKWMRSAAKTLNFAIVYGAQNKKIAKTLKITVEEADKLLEDHKKAFPEIYKFKDYILKLAKSRKSDPHIRTMLGRKRRVWEVLPEIARKEAPKLDWYDPSAPWKAERSILARGERQVINSLVQGSLGDVIKLAMVRMHKLTSEDALSNPGKEIQMILSVHDELVILCPEDRVETGVRLLEEAMIGKEVQDLISVPLDIGDVVVANRWSEAKE